MFQRIADALGGALPSHANVRIKKRVTLDEAQVLCDELHKKDKRSEFFKRWTARLVFFSFLGIGASVLGAIWYRDALKAAPVCAGICVVGLVLWKILGARDVEDRKLDLIMAFLRSLEPELAGREIHLEADFRGYFKTKPVRKQTKWYARGGTFEYEIRWLRLSLPFRDGSSAFLEMFERSRRKVKHKYSKRRGGAYQKITDRHIEDFTMRILPPKGSRFDRGHEGRVAKLLEEWRIRERFGGVKVKLRPRQATVVLRTRPRYFLHDHKGWGPQRGELFEPSNAMKALVFCNRALRATLRRRAPQG